MSGNDADPAALRRKRRSWSLDEKRRIVDESLEDGASIAEVARRHDLNANQLFTWRRQFGVELAAPQELAPILPVTITPDATAEYSAPGSIGQMEIVLAEGDRIIVWADVETAALSRVVKALRR
ncbi:IS66-like element accessory protein TnpA [Methylocystis echinoides]|uniref:Transposase n=1 Tax=Methylocystis echinoides TaxID=29468 RepID=A0A9W6LQ33_9HYPH|nr:transposase [Methylocystis echinoides]GLI91102.1 transposase [Methylocystis echinoides]GLI95825.1 transposase [Methylocystis echinoides]